MHDNFKEKIYMLVSLLQHCVWLVGLTWGLSFTYYTSLVLPHSAFDYLNDGLAGCEPVPQTGVLMLISTCLLYFPTTMILLYVYGTVFHSNIGKSTVTNSECNHQCTAVYCNVSLLPFQSRTGVCFCPPIYYGTFFLLKG